MKALNNQFASWIASASTDRTHELWEEAAKQYLGYAEQLRLDFKDVIDRAALRRPRATAPAPAPSARIAGEADSEKGDGYDIYVFGDGSNGQLGLGEDVLERPRPTRLKLPPSPGLPARCAVRSIAVGGMHCVAVTVNGDVYTWGVNDEGALGRDAASSNDYKVAAMSDSQLMESQGKISETLPGRVDMSGACSPRARAVCASAGDSHSVVVFDDGCAAAWGAFRNTSGLWAFCHNLKVAWSPRRIYSPKLGDSSSQLLSCKSGLDHVLLLTRAGHVLSFGCGEKGRLGRLSEHETESDDPKGDEEYKKRCLIPSRVTFPSGGSPVSRVGCGSFTSYAIRRDGRMFAWGINNYGQLAISKAGAQEALGAEVVNARSSAGELDRCVEGPFFYPVLCDELSSRGLHVLDVAGGEHHSLFTCRGSSGAELYAAGRPAYGRLGTPNVDSKKDAFVGQPQKVHFEAGVSCAAAGTTVSGAVSTSGELYVWGDGESGLLCRPASAADAGDAVVPERVKLPDSMKDVKVAMVALGGQHGAILAK